MSWMLYIGLCASISQIYKNSKVRCLWLLPVVAALSEPCFLPASPDYYAHGARALVAAVESGRPQRAAEQQQAGSSSAKLLWSIQSAAAGVRSAIGP